MARLAVDCGPRGTVSLARDALSREDALSAVKGPGRHGLVKQKRFRTCWLPFSGKTEFASGVFEDLFHRGLAVEDGLETLFAQGAHAEFDRLLAEHHTGGPLVDHLAQGVVEP